MSQSATEPPPACPHTSYPADAPFASEPEQITILWAYLIRTWPTWTWMGRLGFGLLAWWCLLLKRAQIWLQTREKWEVLARIGSLAWFLSLEIHSRSQMFSPALPVTGFHACSSQSRGQGALV